MRKHLFISLSLIAVLSGCSTNEEVERSDFKALSFETFVGKGTRAVVRTDFADGDDFGVYAYEHGSDLWEVATTSKQLFMDNVKVSRQSGTWTYSPTKYWKDGVKYTFLAYSPHNEGYMQDPMNGRLLGITTAAKVSEQTDLLYARPDAGSKDLEWTEGRTVTMNFRHAMAQIKVSVSTDEDYSGYYTAAIRQIQLAGIDNSGELDLNVPDDDTSPWKNQGSTVTGGYTATVPGLDVPLTVAEVLLNDAPNLFMQIPQEIQDGQATFKITYDITPTASGNMEGTGTGLTAEIKISGCTWQHNHIYHYKIQMNLQQLLGLKPIEVGEPDVTLWEAGGETHLPKDLTVTIQPSAEGDAAQTGTGNATLGITKSSQTGETQTVEIVNPEKTDQWMVEVGPEITDASAPVTRTEKKAASWVRVCEDGKEDAPKERLYGTENATIKIKITEANTTIEPRQAEITIKRALSGITRIVVTQAKAEAAIIEANSTQFAKTGGENQLTIINPATSSPWTLSKSNGADWLSLLSASDRTAITTGTGNTSVIAVATANTTASVRTATITLKRDGQTDVNVEVTQAARLPMSVSANNFSISYLNGNKTTLIVTNPEAADNTFNWTLSGAPAWLSVSPVTGTGATTDKVTLTANATNTAASARSATLALKRQGQADISINVTQAGASATTLSPASVSVDYSAQSRTFNVSGPAGITWNLASSQSWMTLSKTSGSGNAAITVTVTESSSQFTRSGTVTLSREGQNPVTFKLTQGKAPEPKPTVTPATYYEKASAAMNSKVYSFTVTAPVGRKWTAKIMGNPYGFYKYMSFSKQYNSVYEITGRMSSGTFKVYIHDVTNLTAGLGLIYIYVDGEEQPLTAGFIISKN